MSFCSNCGNKLKEGDVFCGSCGARCDGANGGAQQAAVQQNYQQPAAPVSSVNTEAFSRHAKQMLDIVVGMLIKPASTMKNLVHTVDQTTTLILGAILAIIQGIFSLWTLGQFVSMIDKFIVKFATSMGTLMGALGGGSKSLDASDLLGITNGISQFRKLIKIPYGAAFFHGIVLYLIVAGLIFLGIFLAGKLIAKANVDALKVLKIAVFATIPVIAAEFLKILLSYISSYLGIFVLLIGILISITAIIVSIKEIMEIDDDKLVFVMSVIFAIIIAFSLFAIWTFVVADAKSIQKSIVDSAMKGLNNLLKQ